MLNLPLLLSGLALNVASAQEDYFGLTASAGVGWIAFDGDENLNSTWSAVPRLGYNIGPRVIIEAELGIHQGRTRSRFAYRYDALTPRVNAVVFLSRGYAVEPYLAAGPGVIWKRVGRDPNSWSAEPLDGEDLGNYKNPDVDLALNVGPGLLIPLGGAMALRADARWLWTGGTEPHGDVQDSFSNVELTAGFLFRQAERNLDTDRDGVADRLDPCPEEPEDYDEFEDDDACPDEDNDEDGVVDRKDRCPMDPEDMDGFKDKDGCPEDDNDNDGITDEDDYCPKDAEDRDGFEDRDGCPEDDNDADGVVDLDDLCPNFAEDRDDFEDLDGCPEDDNDRDSIVDGDDSCVLEPETWNGFNDDDGCPDDVPKEIERFTGVIRGINFEVNSDKITTDSYGLLDEAAAVLLQYPTVRLEIHGHTDSDGKDEYNLELSARRAESVARYLTGRGVPAERLSSKGLGETVPLVANDGPEGKAVNRRVEFRVTEDAATTGE